MQLFSVKINLCISVESVRKKSFDTALIRNSNPQFSGGLKTNKIWKNG